MITSRSNPRVKLVHALQSLRKHRTKEGRFVVEGTRLVDEALSSSQPVDFLLHSPSIPDEAEALKRRAMQRGILVEEVSDEILQYCSATETAPGILAVVPIVTQELPAKPAFLLVADQIANPGNLGTLLRSAAASGVDAVLLTGGTVDAYNPKVVRGAMGAHFRLPIQSTTAQNLKQHLTGCTVWIAEAGASQRYTQVDWTVPSALVIGSEAHGPQVWLSDLGKGVSIPLSGGVESLNAAVAGSVILFEMQRQRGLS